MQLQTCRAAVKRIVQISLLHQKQRSPAALLRSLIRLHAEVPVRKIRTKVFDSQGKSIRIPTLSKNLQPQREKPNKDRGKRFAAGALAGNQPIEVEETSNIVEYQYWTVHPKDVALKNAKLFLLCQVSVILYEGKPCPSAEKCPSTEVVLTVYRYEPTEDTFCATGKTALSNATNILHEHVSNLVQIREHGVVSLMWKERAELQGYLPFYMEVDPADRLKQLLPHECPIPEDEEECKDEYIVEKIVQKKVQHKVWPV